MLIFKVIQEQIACSMDLKLKEICECYHSDFFFFFLAESDLSRYIGINYIFGL